MLRVTILGVCIVGRMAGYMELLSLKTGNTAHAVNIMLSKCAGTERGQALQSIISVKGRDKGTDSEKSTPSFRVLWDQRLI